MCDINNFYKNNTGQKFYLKGESKKVYTFYTFIKKIVIKPVNTRVFDV